MNNTRFAVGVHILAVLSTNGGTPTTSDLLASSVNTHPSLIRRLLSQLNKAGLTRSALGSGGGASLARAPCDITLQDVRDALHETDKVFRMHPEPNPACPVGRNIAAILDARLTDAERAFERELTQTSIEDLVIDLTSKEQQRGISS